MEILDGVPLERVAAGMPNKIGIQYRPSQSTPRASRTPRITKKMWFKGRRLLLACIGNKKVSRLLALPQELLLLIASELPDASRASLALTCSALLSIMSDPELFRGLEFPPEQPQEYQSTRMSKAQVYQPARWEFLRFLEKDLKGKWYLCSECFTLHPQQMFADYENSIVPWLKDYYKLKGSDFRSCRHGRKKLCFIKKTSFAPSGIVDLCPCIKMTIGKKRRIEAWLWDDAQKPHGNDHPAAVCWWHKCRHIYGDIELELEIGLFLYSKLDLTRYISPCITNQSNIFAMPPRVRELGVLLDYRHTYPSTSLRTSPRLLCPHRNLDTAIQDLLRCRDRHPRPAMVCAWCECIQYCQYCRTTVLDLTKTENASARTTCCSYRVERCLDNNLWPMQTVFPFARRQVPLERRSPLPL